jgi:hypothetical protein
MFFIKFTLETEKIQGESKKKYRKPVFAVFRKSDRGMIFTLPVQSKVRERGQHREWACR